jgi:hypothetical protein
VDAHGAAVDAAGTGYRRIALGDGDRDVLEAVIGSADLLGKRIVAGVRRKGGPVVAT